MYKKIKNSSFMNLIWFIIAIVPMLLIAIYSINYFLNKELTYEYQNTPIENKISEPATIRKAQYNNTKNYITFDDSIVGPPIVAIWNANILENENKLWLYFFDESLDNITITITGADTNNTSINVDITIKNDNKPINFTTFKNENNISTYNSIIINSLSNANLTNNEIIYYFISNEQLNMSKEEIKNYCTENNLFYINNYQAITSYELYLETLLNSIQTNGFISNAFLNLSQLFGVTNVYYSLACYYIEYLLVIVLLHLAFDVLYMLPNICHKFMEKIGGERD